MKERHSIIIDKCFDIFEELEDGKRVRLTDLAQEVASYIGDEEDNVSPITTIFVHTADNIRVEKGRLGGAYKGEKKEKPKKEKAKKSKKDKQKESSDSTDSEESN